MHTDSALKERESAQGRESRLRGVPGGPVCEKNWGEAVRNLIND